MIRARRLTLISLATALQGCHRAVASVRPVCREPAPPPLSALQVERFLNSTREVQKTYIDVNQFDTAVGTLWRFQPALAVSFRQHWMSVPVIVTIVAMKVGQSTNRVATLLLRVDDSVLPLEGGDLKLLGCDLLTRS
jgi:hypothetical protein